MPFLSPWFLLGAAAIAVPIWLHLIRHEQAVRVPFSSLMFFRQIPRKSFSRQKLKYLLLLSARILAVLLIALAFARPFLAGGSRLLGLGAGDRHVVILLDVSLSMQYGDRWQRALEAAQEEIAALGEQDRAQIVTFSSDSEIHNIPSAEKPALRAILDDLTPGASTTSYAQAFRAAEGIAEDVQKPLSVVLISDMQQSGAMDSQQGLRSPYGAALKLVDVSQGGEQPNWTVAASRSRRVIYQSKYPDRFQVQLQGFHTPEAPRRVEFVLGGKTVGTQSVVVPASGVATAVFENFDVPLGASKAEIRITPADGLPADDTFFLALERRQSYRLLFLQQEGENAELYYLRTALAAEPDSPFEIDARTPGEAASLDLSRYAMVIASNIGSVPSSLASKVTDFVQGGGGILFTMGSRSPVQGQAGPWGDLLPGRLMERRVMTRDAERWVLVGDLAMDHPLFREFQQTGADSLRSAEVYAYVRVQPEGTESNVLMRLANGDPALLEKKAGRGRSLLFTSSFDNVWSDFPLHAAFLPLVHQMIRYTAQLADEPPAFSIPAAVSLRNYGHGSEDELEGRVWDVTGPEGEREVPLAEEMRPDFLLLRRPGFYQVHQGGGDDLIAANIDPLESDLASLPEEDRAVWTPGAPEQEGATVSTAGVPLAARQEIWWPLLLAALLVVVAETFLANQHLGVRRTEPVLEKAPEKTPEKT